MPKVVCFANMKGGVGKTTLCVNLGFALFGSGKKVLIVDNDPQFNATTALLGPQKYLQVYINPTATHKTIYDVYEKPPRVAGGNTPKDKGQQFFLTRWYLIKTPIKTPKTRLDILASRIELYETLRNPSQKEYLLDKFLSTHAQDYDYVLIDCPPTPSVLTLSAFAASQFVLIPATADYFSTFGLPQFLGTLLDFKANLHDEHDVRPLGLVFTNVPRVLTPESREAIARVEHTLNKTRDEIDVPVFTSRISHFKVYEKALWQSVPVQKVSGRGIRGKEQSTGELATLTIEFEATIKRIESTKKL